MNIGTWDGSGPAASCHKLRFCTPNRCADESMLTWVLVNYSTLIMLFPSMLTMLTKHSSF